MIYAREWNYIVRDHEYMAPLFIEKRKGHERPWKFQSPKKKVRK